MKILTNNRECHVADTGLSTWICIDSVNSLMWALWERESPSQSVKEAALGHGLRASECVLTAV